MALDPRAIELAKIVVGYSTGIKKGEAVLIQGEYSNSEFMCEIARQVIDKGAYPVMQALYPEVHRHLLEKGDEEMLTRLLEAEKDMWKQVDAIIMVDAERDPDYLQGVSAEKIAKREKVYRLFSDIYAGNGGRYPGKKWCDVGFPTQGIASAAGFSVKDFSDRFYAATNIDWLKMSEEMKRIKTLFDNANDVHILVPGRTDFHISLKGRGGAIFDGKRNMPDGEILWGPVEDSANGCITFCYPMIMGGHEVRGLRLVFRNGEVIESSADKSYDFVQAMLNLKGAKKLGEFAVGCNYNIRDYMKNILFDEKIGGTIHIALGDSYKYPLSEGGGLNVGDIHWDLVCELRKTGNEPGGKIFVDGKLVQENGKWLGLP